MEVRKELEAVKVDLHQKRIQVCETEIQFQDLCTEALKNKELLRVAVNAHSEEVGDLKDSIQRLEGQASALQERKRKV